MQKELFMRFPARTVFSVVCLLLIASWTQGQTAASTTASPHAAKVVESYGKLPLAFEANQGQSDSQVRFLSRGGGYSLFLTPTEAVLALQRSVNRHQPPAANSPAPAAQQSSPNGILRMRLLGANGRALMLGQDEMSGKSNYFIGNDPKSWHTGVPLYARVRYENVYPGVDLVYY